MGSEWHKEYLGADWEGVLNLIRTSLRSDISLLNQANDNILSHGGKMLRPALSLLMAKACGDGKANEDSRRFAAAAELLHNATLLHDDVADASSERRGFPTTASILGNNASVLLGDFWLVRAMELILESGSYSDEVVRLFSKTLSDLAEGEMLQLQKASECDTTEEDYFSIIYSKTASLFEASCVSAAISVGASDRYRQAAREYGTRIGIAFQIKDDILDYVASDALGKPTGVDLMEKKITLPLLGALKNAGPDSNASIRGMLCRIDEQPENFAVIRDFVFANGGMEYATAMLKEYVIKAKDALLPLPRSKERSMLEKLADFTAYRKS